MTPPGALAWLQRSGIQREEGSSDAGAVHAWIDLDTGVPGFLYSEITGYFMSLCANLHTAAPSGDWVLRADRAARWVARRALHPTGALLARKYAVGTSDPFAFERGHAALFDCAMVGAGLLNLATRDAETDAAIERLCGFLCQITPACLDVGSSVWDLGVGRPLPPSERWSLHAGPFLLKMALCLERYARASGDATAAALCDRLLDETLRSQRPDGGFASSLDGETTHLHPHLYAVEGLLHLAAHRRALELLAPARRALDRALAACLTPDTMDQQWSPSPTRRIRGVRSDTIAQWLRADAIHRALTRSAPAPDAERLFAVLDAHQSPSGGTLYGRDEHGLRRHENAWCHFFRIEAHLARGWASAGADLTGTLILT